MKPFRKSSSKKKLSFRSCLRLSWFVFISHLYFLNLILYELSYLVKDFALYFENHQLYITTTAVYITTESITSPSIDYLMALSFFYLCFFQSKSYRSPFYIPVLTKHTNSAGDSVNSALRLFNFKTFTHSSLE